MIHPKVTKGRVVLVSPTAATTSFREFFFNPNTISDKKETNYGALEIPGASHPVYQFGSGGEREILFDLYLDGDRGKSTSRKAAEGFSIASDIAFYRSLNYPIAFDGVGMVSVYPHTVLLTIGELYKGIPCIVKPVKVQYHYFAPDMTPIRATVSLHLAEITIRSQTFSDVQPGR